MIQGRKKQELEPETILQKLTPYDIYRFYLGEFKLGKAMKSPFRRDQHPSFCVRAIDGAGALYHVDYGDETFRGNCFKLVMQLFGCTFRQALEKIDNDFGLGIAGGPTHDWQRIVLQYEQPKLEERRHNHMLVITRPFTLEELAYWNQYHLSADDLKKNGVFGVDKVYFRRQLVPNYGKLLRFAYFSEPYWKIYRPHAPKGEKFYPNNHPNDYIEDLGALTGSEKGVITKSRKDRMVIQKLLPHVCSVQNESMIAFTEDNVDFIKQNCQQPWVAFDNDQAGKKASRRVTEEFGWKHINVPDHYLPDRITDFADLAREHGLARVERHFKAKGLLI